MIPKTGQTIHTMKFGVRFNDKEQSITTVTKGSHNGKTIAEHTKEWIDDRKIYFKRKLMGK